MIVDDSLRTLVQQARAVGHTWAEIGHAAPRHSSGSFPALLRRSQDPSAEEEVASPVAGAVDAAVRQCSKRFSTGASTTLVPTFDSRMLEACSVQLLADVREKVRAIRRRCPGSRHPDHFRARRLHRRRNPNRARARGRDRPRRARCRPSGRGILRATHPGDRVNGRPPRTLATSAAGRASAPVAGVRDHSLVDRLLRRCARHHGPRSRNMASGCRDRPPPHRAGRGPLGGNRVHRPCSLRNHWRRSGGDQAATRRRYWSDRRRRTDLGGSGRPLLQLVAQNAAKLNPERPELVARLADPNRRRMLRNVTAIIGTTFAIDGASQIILALTVPTGSFVADSTGPNRRPGHRRSDHAPVPPKSEAPARRSAAPCRRIRARPRELRSPAGKRRPAVPRPHGHWQRPPPVRTASKARIGYTWGFRPPILPVPEEPTPPTSRLRHCFRPLSPPRSPFGVPSYGLSPASLQPEAGS